MKEIPVNSTFINLDDIFCVELNYKSKKRNEIRFHTIDIENLNGLNSGLFELFPFNFDYCNKYTLRTTEIEH